VTLADIEIITQLMDAAAQRGLDLKMLTLRGDGGTSVEFSRPPADPPNPYTLPTLPYRPFGDADVTPGVITAPNSKPATDLTHPALWKSGKPPSFQG
jgi:hypothetical protein